MGVVATALALILRNAAGLAISDRLWPMGSPWHLPLLQTAIAAAALTALTAGDYNATNIAISVAAGVVPLLPRVPTRNVRTQLQLVRRTPDDDSDGH